jgi:hypothetical protein
MFADLVKAGTLPPVDQRLPKNYGHDRHEYIANTGHWRRAFRAYPIPGPPWRTARGWFDKT